MERRVDLWRERVVGGSEHAGRSLRARQDSKARLHREKTRLVCTPCRSRIDWITSGLLEVAYRPRPGLSEFNPDGTLMLADSRTWRCKRGHAYPVTLARMRVEHAAAVERGDRTVSLPLPRR